VTIPRITKETEWTQGPLKAPTDSKDIEFADGTKGTIWRWNKKDVAPKEYHVPHVINEFNIVQSKWHYESDADAIKTLYFFQKCRKMRGVSVINP
jgi:hypothetical protein